jgi:hypothetical protein
LYLWAVPRRLLSSFGLALAAAVAAAAGCIARGDGPLVKQTADDGGPPAPKLIDSGVPAEGSTLPPTDPHAVLGVDPPHGPWNGGQRALVRGNGFSAAVRVWFGEVEIARADVVPLDPKRVQVAVPPGSDVVDVTTQNGDDSSTRRTLPGGYEYDRFYVEPASGPVSGGTLITLHGQGTAWNDETEVLVDQKPCAPVERLGPEKLRCPTPVGSPGTKPIRTLSEGVAIDVLDAFTYGDSNNGYRGGLSGEALKRELRVIALDGWTGAALGGATVVLDEGEAAELVKRTDGNGVAVFQSDGLGPKRSVTIAKKCYQPVTFVEVPVDTVTAYLGAVLSPDCASEGDPPPTGGNPSQSGTISGELVWKDESKEFQRGGWTNVPLPEQPGEKYVAYVFRLTEDAKREFQLPSESLAVTPNAGGPVGFTYSLTTGAGNHTLYALAGIENREISPPYFLAYAMGVARGISTRPGAETSDVFIAMDTPLDHALALAVEGPAPTPKGPDRLLASVAVRVNETGYAILPGGQRTLLYPTTAPLSFVGLPPLTGSLAGGQYVATARAVTGPGNLTPRSAIGFFATTVSGGPIPLEGFVQIPKLVVPSENGTWNGRDLEWTLGPGGASVELAVIEVSSGGGLVTWEIAVPAGVSRIRLPDLTTLGAELGLAPGPVTISLTLAHIEAFDYGSLRYRQLDERGWDAHASDTFYAHP